MSNGNMVNIGTSERPIWVSETALQPQTPEGREWWEMVASGSVALPKETLDKLLQEGDGRGD